MGLGNRRAGQGTKDTVSHRYVDIMAEDKTKMWKCFYQYLNGQTKMLQNL